MRTKNLLLIIIAIIMIISCDKDGTNTDKVLDWSEYTGYIPLPDKEAIWINKVYSEDIPIYGNTPNTRTFTNQYYYNGDTLINNISYKKVYNKQLVKNYYYESDTYSQDSSILYSGALRQIIQNKKVYFVFASNNQEQLLYDFDLSIGDTVQVYKINRTTEGVVTCIDSILIGNRYYDVFYIIQGGCNNCYSFIEGIGGSYGLILESEGSLPFIHDVDYFRFKYKGENLDISWNTYPENCN